MVLFVSGVHDRNDCYYEDYKQEFTLWSLDGMYTIFNSLVLEDLDEILDK